MLFSKIIESKTGLKVSKELKFHPKRRWRFDYAIPDVMIAIEVEGGAYTQGRHTRGTGFIGDMEKYNQAALLGWTVIRFTPEQTQQSKTIEFINEIVKSKLK